MVRLLDRKRFGHALGVAGLGVGMLTGAVSAASAAALETQPQGIDRPLLLQNEEGVLDLGEDELKQLLIQLLQERAQATDGARAVQGEEDGRDLLIARERGDHDTLRVEAYNEFTHALADELGIDDPGALDAAIRVAMMSVVDANDGLTDEEAERQKALIATSDVPIGPAYRGHGG